MGDIFENDETYKKQIKEADKQKKIEEAYKFIGYRVVKSCLTCDHNKDGKCDIMLEYIGLNLDISEFGKCKHYIDRKPE